jgi:predicted transcriptional regulator
VKVKDVMSYNVTCCSPDARLPEVARAMVECDCGEIPVVDDEEGMRPIGVITDRDIVMRAVAAAAIVTQAGIARRASTLPPRPTPDRSRGRTRRSSRVDGSL